jgi:hypothetical protein
MKNFLYDFFKVVPESWYRSVHSELVQSHNDRRQLEARIESMLEERATLCAKLQNYELTQMSEAKQNRNLAPISISQKPWGQLRRELELQHRKREDS